MIDRTHTTSPTGRHRGSVGAFAVGVTLCLTLSVGAAPAAVAQQVSAATVSKSAVPVFKNCAALNAKYPGGVAKAGIKFNLVNGKKKTFSKRPTFSTALYTANKKRDRDKDGIACER